MFNIIITSSATYVFRDNSTINTIEDNFNTVRNSLMGFLLHQEGIKEMIGAISISKYYVQTGQGNTEEISKDQAFMLYDMILDYHKKRSEKETKSK